MGSTYFYILQFDEKYIKNTIYRRPDKESKEHMHIPILKTFKKKVLFFRYFVYHIFYFHFMKVSHETNMPAHNNSIFYDK